MQAFKSPYNFVPLSETVHTPEWVAQVSHDVPFRDGISGSFDLIIEAKTPIFTRDDTEKDPPNGTIHPFLSHDGTPKTAFIKGSSIRGMLREVLSIASYAKFSKVDDRRFGLRDISSSNTPYAKLMRNATPGWLSIDESEGVRQISLRPCSAARVHKKHLEEFHLTETGKPWRFRDYSSIKDRNEKWLAPREITARLEKGTREMLASKLGLGTEQGTLVFFGFIRHSKGDRHEKKAAYFFYDEQKRTLPVSDELWQKFEWAHSSTQQSPELSTGHAPAEALRHWLEKLKTNPKTRIPVYYLTDPKTGEVSALGLAKMFRLASHDSVHDAINHVATDHLDPGTTDLADLIFGMVGLEDEATDTPGRALRGRVSITHADILASSANSLSPVRALLASPRASFNPAYLKGQTNGTIGHWRTSPSDTPRTQVAGWKRYPARTQVNAEPPQGQKRNDNQVDLATKFIPLDAGACFKARVYVHNLRPQELGALFWTLNFGGHLDGKLVHHLGMAKSLGYGQVQLRADNLHLNSNDPQAESISNPQQLAEIYEDYMDTVIGGWLSSQPLVHLLAMANPENGDPDKLLYPMLSEFSQIRNKEKALGAPAGTEETKTHLEAARNARRIRYHEREQARQAGLSLEERIRERVEQFTEQKALDRTREQIHQKGDKINSDDEREIWRKCLYERYYPYWSKGKPRGDSRDGHIPTMSAKKFKEYASWLLNPDAPDELSKLAADGPGPGTADTASTEDGQPTQNIPADDALDSLPDEEAAALRSAGTDKGPLKDLWINPVQTAPWATASVEQYLLQALESLSGTPEKKWKKKDQKWIKEIKKYLKKRQSE